jgi:hypothetical protein
LGRQSGKQTTFAHVCFTSRIERLHSTSSSSVRFECITPRTIRNTQVDAVEVRDRNWPWHRITQKTATAANDLPIGADVSWPFTLAASQNGLERRKWNYVADSARLAGLNLIPLPTGSLCTEAMSVGAGTCLNGYLWHHARTDIGYTIQDAGGTYVGKRGDDGSDLANQFVPIAPDEAKMLLTKAIGKYRRIWWWQKLTDPLGPLLDDPRPVYHARPMGIDEGNRAVLIHDIGGGEDATAFLSPDVKASAEGRIIASSFEPAGTPHQLSKSVEGAIVADNGTRILDLLVNDKKTLKTGTEMGWHVESGDSSEAPSPRTDFISFYSPMLGGVVVAGGKDQAGKPIGTVHLYRFDLGWIRIPTTFTNVRAAIFSPADGMLWVLDAVSKTSMRLYRIDPLTMTVGRDASFTWDASTFPSHHLGLDANGKVLLVANMSTTSSKTMRLEVNPLDGKLIGTGLLQNEYRQSAPPIAAFGETSFIREDAQGRIVGVDRSRTVPSGATLNIAGMFK